MDVILAIAQLGIPGFGVALFVVLVATYRLGAVVGMRRRERAGREVEEVSFAVTGMLGLLAFTLGLTLSMAQARYEDRRHAALQEANAIGTAWLRSHAIGHPRGVAIAGLLEEYLRQRIAFVRADRGAPDIEAVNARTSALQGEIWGHAAAIAQERTDAVAALFLAALNEAFDTATAQRWAFAGRVLSQVVWLVLACSVLAIGGIGYQFGMKGRRHPFASLLLIAMYAAATAVILDLSAPRLGGVRVDTRVYEWTLQGFGTGLRIPPSPPR